MSSASKSISKLFQPTQVGKIALAHRVVMAPLTRTRADINHVHTDLAVEYYSQRASVPGTLLISEATMIGPQAGGRDHVPYIHNQAQIKAWKKVTDAVHAKGSFIYAQLWALGRTAKVDILEKEGFELIGAGSIPMQDRPAPRPLTISEIEEFVELYRRAAENAIEAGFDGVELHMANGFLPDQFLQDVTNNRTDEYGGSVENRARFLLEVIDAVVKAVGQERTAMRISPWSTHNGMLMKDPKPTFSYFLSRVSEKYPDFSYVHVIESATPLLDSSEYIRNIWSPKRYISNLAYTRETAIATADEQDVLISFGSLFISNPDLPLRLMKDLPLAVPDLSTFYTPMDPKGYIDYPFATEQPEPSL